MFVGNGTSVYNETTKECHFKDSDSCDYTYFVALDPKNVEFERTSEIDPYFDHLFIHLPPKSSRSELSVFCDTAVADAQAVPLGCPGSIDVIPIVVGIVVGIVAIGLLLLLIWWLLYKFAVRIKLSVCGNCLTGVYVSVISRVFGIQKRTGQC